MYSRCREVLIFQNPEEFVRLESEYGKTLIFINVERIRTAVSLKRSSQTPRRLPARISSVLVLASFRCFCRASRGSSNLLAALHPLRYLPAL